MRPLGYRRTRRVLAVIATCGLLGAATASAPPALGVGISSSNVTYLGTVATEAGSAPQGARRVGKYLYVGGLRSFSIYDVSDPVAPDLVSHTPTGAQFPNEDIDTNGKVLLVSNELGKTLQVWDVEDKAAPQLLTTVPDVGDHTFSCVHGCKWAYGSRGSIVDLRKPSEAKVAGSWGTLPGSDGFDTTEVSRGMLLTATRTINLLDARRDPRHPSFVAYGNPGDNRLIHSLRWPNGGRDRFFLVQGETPLSRRCNDTSGAFMTWDATHYRSSKTFTMVDEFRVGNGTYVDGDPPANALGCTTMWFQEHSSFRNGGLVAAAFFEHGTRFLNVDRRGRISQVGYFTPIGGETVATYWITKDIVYAVDITRGIDILRFTRS